MIRFFLIEFCGVILVDRKMVWMRFMVVMIIK